MKIAQQLLVAGFCVVFSGFVWGQEKLSSGAAQVEQSLQDKANTVEARLLQLVNDYRKEHNQTELKQVTELTNACKVLTDAIVETDQFSHQAGGTTPFQRAKTAGYDWQFLSENIFYAGGTVSTDDEQLATQAFKTWVNSPGHQQNLLNSEVTECGMAVQSDTELKRVYVVMKFGLRK